MAGLIETDNSGSALYPEVAVDASGNAIAVWEQFDGTRNNIWSNRYTAGTGWGTAALIETDNSGGAGNPQVAVDASGNAIAVWVQFGGTRNDIWSNRYTVGKGWGMAELIETDNSGNAENPQVAVDASGNAIAVWHQSDGTRNNIWSNRYTVDTGWGTAVLIETDNSGDAENPQVAVDPTGNAIAVWRQYDGTRRNIWSNRYTVGAGWGTAVLIETDNSGDAWKSQVAVDALGNAIAVWEQSDGSRYNIWSNRYTAGAGWGTAVLIETDNSGSSYNSQVAVDASGNAIAVWRQYDGTQYNIWSNRYTVGTGWGTAVLIETDNSGNAWDPQVAVDASGNAIAVWYQSDGIRFNIWSNRYTVGTGWGTAVLIETDNSIFTEKPQVAVDASGNAIAVWRQFDGSRYNIWSNRYIKPDTTSPPLTLSSPAGGFTTDRPIVSVSGATEAGAVLSINGILVDVRSDGTFSCNISLFDGENAIVVTARDAWDNTATLSRFVTYNDPLPSLLGDMADVLGRLNSLETEMLIVQESFDSVWDNISSLGSDLNATSGDLVLLRENFSILRGKVNNIDDDLDGILENITFLLSGFNGTESDLDSVRDTVSSVQTKLDLIGASLDSLQADLNDTRDDLAKVSASQDSQGSDVESTRSDLGDLRSSILILVLIIALILFAVMLVLYFNLRKKISISSADDSD